MTLSVRVGVPMSDLPRDDDGVLLVPKGVLEGIDDAVNGRTTDGDDLDDVLSWMGDGDE